MAPPALFWFIVVYQWTVYFQLVDAALRCYFPDGSEADNDSPCNPDADASFCCSSSSNSFCLNNLLCQDGVGRVVRGSCTDQSWNDPACPPYCKSFDTGGEDLISCNNVTKDHVSYCCDHVANCCDTGDARFEVLPWPTSVIAAWNSAATEFKPLSGASATTSSVSPTISTSTISPTTTVVLSTTTSTTPTTSSSPVSDPSTNGSGLSRGAQIGIGVGISGGVLLAALLAYLFWRVHKTHNAVKQQQNLNSHPHPHPPSTVMTDNGFSPSYAQSYQYKSPSFAPATPAQLPADSEVSSEARTYELPINSS